MDSVYFDTPSAPDMMAFDRLPPAVREALRNCLTNLSAELCERYLAAGHSEATVLKSLAYANQQKVRERYNDRGVA